MREHEFYQLESAINEITQSARQYGLDFFSMRYELCPAEILYTIGAYGMPTRYSHWSFGKSFHRMKMEYDFQLSKIYELVINSDPCYAFLLENNSLLQNKLIVAHVLGHSDFFKNNAYFSLTNRNMVESMAVAAERIQQWEYEYGIEKVEAFLDAGMSIQEHIDPHRIMRDGSRHGVQRKEDVTQDKEKKEEKDLLLFIADCSRSLEDWEREILHILREEMLYFWPQMETKIMNEGWATFWHIRLMRELELTEAETLDFARMNAGVIQPSPTSINPYFLGLSIFRHLEEKYGLPFLFEVREADNDVSFLRNYLDEEIIEKMDLYLYGKQANEYRISSKDWKKIKQQLIRSRTNGGYPYLVAVDDDYNKNGELYLKHVYEGLELDPLYVRKTLPNVYHLWRRPVHLETVVKGKPFRYHCADGKTVKEN